MDRPAARETSYPDLVYEVFLAARRPLTFHELFDEVHRLRPVTTRDPQTTIRQALAQARQLISPGDGRYGYLPYLLAGSLLRLSLTEQPLTESPLIYTEEARDALWPTFFEIQKRKDMRPVTAELRGAGRISLPLEFLGTGTWGSHLPQGLRRYLRDHRAAAGDCLLIRVLDGEKGRCEAWLEPRSQRDESAIKRRNREIADAAYQLFRHRPKDEKPQWELTLPLLGRGLYLSDVAPDPLESILHADPRFVYAGLMMWMLASAVTPEVKALLRQRSRYEPNLLRLGGGAPGRSPQAPPSPVSRDVTEQDLARLAARQITPRPRSIEDIWALVRELQASDTRTGPRRGPGRRRT